MTTLPTPTTRFRPPDVEGVTAFQVCQAFFGKFSENTRRAYEGDLAAFADFLDASGTPGAIALLLSRGAGWANAVALQWRASMIERQLAPASVNRRLTALRSAVRLGRSLGVCTFALDVPNVRNVTYRDTAGPGLPRVEELLADLKERAAGGGKLAARNLAIVRLLFHLGLRRAEVCGLDLADYDADEQRLAILGKGRTQKQWLTLDRMPAVVQATELWLAHRGAEPGPLFLACDPASRSRTASRGLVRLAPHSVWRLLRKYDIRPHGLRHTAITTVADLSGGNMKKMLAFSRHQDPSVIVRYLDNLADDAGEMAGLLAERVS